MERNLVSDPSLVVRNFSPQYLISSRMRVKNLTETWGSRGERRSTFVVEATQGSLADIGDAWVVVDDFNEIVQEALVQGELVDELFAGFFEAVSDELVIEG